MKSVQMNNSIRGAEMKLDAQYLKNKGIAFTEENGKLTVGGSLDLRGCTGLTALPDNLTVGGSLDLRGCTWLTALPDNLTVGGYLDLRGCTGLTALPDNLTVGGYLDLEGCTWLTALPDNLTVGGSLDLRGCTGLTALPDGLTVGGSLDLEGCTGLKRNYQVNRPPENFSLSVKMSIEAKFNMKGFTIADGVLAKILHVRDEVKKILVVGKKVASYLASDESGNYAHGDTVSEAMQELAFKTSSRDVSAYKNMPAGTSKSLAEWTNIYRIVTGACRFGTKDFIVKNNLEEREYTLEEVLTLTSGAYGGERFKSVVIGGAS